MMKHLTASFTSSIVTALLLITAANAQPGFAPQFLPSLSVPSIDGKITVDGVLDEPAWRQAAVAANFAENNPGNQVRPQVETKVYIAYGETNLYLAFVAFDDPATIRYSYSDRDEIFNDDYIGIMIDTYGDATWGYEIFVNPLGIQGDLRMTTGGQEDISFDMIFESVGQVTDSGYQVELAIPFTSLRFPDQPEQVWRANFWRDRQRDIRRRMAWAAQDRDNPCFMCQWGYLTGIKGIRPGNDLEILPNMIALQNGAITDNSSLKFENQDPDAELSINARYGLTSNSSIEATLNPDFSQVESDAAQIDVNTPFRLFYSETRPFFQEGADLFDTWLTAVYTRSINNPEAAGKFTGQFGGTRVGYMFARDENSPLLVPLQQQTRFSFAGKSISSIARVRQSLGEESHIGAVFTDRRIDDFNAASEGGSGTTFGVDSRLRFSRQYRLAIQILGSYTDEITAPGLVDTSHQARFDNSRHTVAFDNERYWGHAVFANLSRGGRVWNLDASYYEFSPTFRADNGFIHSNDFREIEAWTGFHFRPNRRLLIDYEPSIAIGRKWHHTGTINLAKFDESAFDEWVRPSLYLLLKGQTEVNIQYLSSQERFAGTVFPGISIFTFSVDARPTEVLSGGFRYSEGRTIRRDFSAPELGYGTDFTVYANFKPTRRLYIQPEISFSKLDHRDGWLRDHPGEPENVFEGYILRNRLTYQFTRELSLRLVVQYNDFNEALDIEPLITYKLNAFTVFFVGVTGNYQNFYPDADNNLSDPEWKLNSRRFFAKLQYLFRM